MNPVKLMTNIKPDYYAFIEREAKKQSKTKRAILEEAIKIYMREIKKEKMIAAYKKMAEDKGYLEEQKEMAEWGMDYFLIDIDNADK